VNVLDSRQQHAEQHDADEGLAAWDAEARLLF
jgi:hypothetical protein